ncbi:type I-E CRISPR-associated protein Cse1/CasA [Actinokineospora auranticolor]|uniref:CRISPR system Cascade subunit CasA n=1 Tax=Actinokineospora auranticolor TaxID=155976 RepID=A0A2S6GEY0_9PSEU|nr:type I-E CRISPR-associated protein Cse1/CasA [Actinokineospora auranticolor]PPK63772.1 CRISPR system Cascade subunit CasA [Actinokineospora auranticolor]
MNSGSGDDSDPHVDVVLVRTGRDGWATPVGGAAEVVLTDPGPPDATIVAELLAAAVRLVSDVDLPDEVVWAIEDSPTPELFRRSPWLHRHKVLVLRDGRCAVDGHVLVYDPVSGIRVVEVGAEPESEPGFDLGREPWIPVVTVDGDQEFVGIEDVILRAHELRRIAAEAPTMTAALHRLILAVFHRVYGPPSENAWAELWSADAFAEEPVRDYLRRHEFDLFHPKLPFMQCAALASLPPATPGKLVPYRAVGNNVTLFDHTTATDRLLLTPAEAARWLVTTQAFDPGGMKTPYEKDKSSERAPCNGFGVVLVEGATLKETLLLNAIVYRPLDELPPMTTAEDHPVWESATGPAPTPDRRTPRGWTDLLTWPSRRVLLSTTRVDGELKVDGVVLTPGTRLSASGPDEEKMAAYRKPRGPRGKPKQDAPMYAVRLDAVRRIWRHSVELFTVDNWQEGRSRQRPPALDQIDTLVERGAIYRSAVYTLRVFGQRLDSKASVVEAWLEDEVSAPVALMRATRSERFSGFMGAAIMVADDAGSALRALQSEFRSELRGSQANPIDLSFWPRLGRPFDTFLRGLAEAEVNRRADTPVADQWVHVVTEAATETADRWLRGTQTEPTKLVVLGRHDKQFRDRLTAAKQRFRADAAAFIKGEGEER